MKRRICYTKEDLRAAIVDSIENDPALQLMKQHGIEVPPVSAHYVTCHIEGAFDGDATAAAALMIGAPNAMRGYVVRAMYESGVRGEALRTVIEMAWTHDHRHLMEAMRTRRQFNRVLRVANFDIPGAVGDPVTIWRGSQGRGLGLARAVAESWTLDRDVACWFAFRNAGADRPPVVIRATCARRAILFYSDARSEAEVLAEDLQGMCVDGDEVDWQQGCERYAARIRASRDLLLAA